jgi:endonuclease III-like uncharacterized protein
MSHNFAEIVEEVKHLSIEEKQELQELIEKYMIEERRQEIYQNYQASLDELGKNKITFSSDPKILRDLLSND